MIVSETRLRTTECNKVTDHAHDRAYLALRVVLAYIALGAGLCWVGSARAHPDIDIAIAEIESRIAQDPTDPDLYIGRGELHRSHENWEAARADYERALALDPSHDIAVFCRGRVRLESGHPEEAIVDLSAYIDRHPDDAEAARLRGRAQARLGRLLAAVSDFDTAIALASRSGATPAPELYLERSRALTAAGVEHRDAALRGLEEGLERLGRAVVLDMEALEIELAGGRVNDALARVDRLAAAATHPAPWLARRGEILERAGRRDEARRAFISAREALDAMPASRRTAAGFVKIELEVEKALGRLAEPDASAPEGRP